MQYEELSTGMRVQLCGVVFDVTAVASSGAVLEAGRWNRIMALPGGQLGDMLAVPSRGYPRLLGHTLDDVASASSS